MLRSQVQRDLCNAEKTARDVSLISRIFTFCEWKLPLMQKYNLKQPTLHSYATCSRAGQPGLMITTKQLIFAAYLEIFDSGCSSGLCKGRLGLRVSGLKQLDLEMHYSFPIYDQP